MDTPGGRVRRTVYGHGEPPQQRDEVDRIVADWSREWPDLDATPLHVLSRVSRLARHLERARAASFSARGLDVWEFDVLSALRRAGEPYELSPGALVQQTLSTSGTMTNRIDRLQRRGLVERRPDAADRRSVKVRLLPSGARVVEEALADLLSREQAMLGDLDTRERQTLAVLLRRLLLPLDPA